MPLAIIRHLPNCQPVLLGIVNESTDPDVDDQAHYMQAEANKRIETFKNEFFEFHTAKFYLQPIDKYDISW